MNRQALLNQKASPAFRQWGFSIKARLPVFSQQVAERLLDHVVEGALLIERELLNFFLQIVVDTGGYIFSKCKNYCIIYLKIKIKKLYYI